ncbi:uncharacterized protein ACBT57_015009 [Dama dama]
MAGGRGGVRRPGGGPDGPPPSPRVCRWGGGGAAVTLSLRQVGRPGDGDCGDPVELSRGVPRLPSADRRRTRRDALRSPSFPPDTPGLRRPLGAAHPQEQRRLCRLQVSRHGHLSGAHISWLSASTKRPELRGPLRCHVKRSLAEHAASAADPRTLRYYEASRADPPPGFPSTPPPRRQAPPTAPPRPAEGPDLKFQAPAGINSVYTILHDRQHWMGVPVLHACLNLVFL